MKQFLLLTLVALLTTGLSAQVIYVDADATGGMDDGSSWENAYTELDSALVNAEPGASVWVAAGTYTTPADRSFIIMDSLRLYGGFAGGETSLDAADPDANLTVLSGDVLGNDTDGVYTPESYADNQRILLIDGPADTLRDFTVVIDGFTMRNGSVADPAFTVANLGGAIHSRAVVLGSRLRFFNNRSVGGSVASLFGFTCSGSTFDDIEVARNFTANGRAFYIQNTNNVSFTNSTFTGSGAPDPTGIMIVFSSGGFLVDNCEFSDVTVGGAGAGVLIGDANATITNTDFDNMQGTDGAAVFYQTTEPFPNPDAPNWFFRFDDNTVTNCRAIDATTSYGGGVAVRAFVSDVIANGQALDGVFDTIGSYTAIINRSVFENNVAGSLGATDFVAGLGGGLGFTNVFVDTTSFIRISGAEFNNNQANDGAGLYMSTTADIVVDSSSFVGNQGIGGNNAASVEQTPAGAAINTNNDRGVTVIDACTFTNNTLSSVNTTFGGAVAILPQAIDQPLEGDNRDNFAYIINNSTFTGNVGRFGGAVYGQGSYLIDVRNSTFDTNGSGNVIDGVNRTERGGAIFANASSNCVISIDNSEFTNNAVITNGGGAIQQLAFLGNDARFFATNSLFSGNGAGDQADGGAVDMIGNVNELVIDNCDFLINTAAGQGGAIALSAFAGEDEGEFFQTRIEGRITRSYFSENFTNGQGGAISTQSSVVDLYNNVFTSNEAGDGGGGAIIFNGNVPAADDDGNLLPGASYQLTSNVIHNTFYNNTKPEDNVGTQIAVFQPGVNVASEDTNSITLNLVNNAFIMPDGIDDNIAQIEVEELPLEDQPDFRTAAGMIEFNSFGGNFINTAEGINVDLNTEEIFTMADGDVVSGDLNDDFEFEAFFSDPNDGQFDGDITNNFTLICNDENTMNPLIDAGVLVDFLPPTDIEGGDRVVGDAPDIGAFEADCTVSTDDVEAIEAAGLAMKFFPNPTADVLNIQNDVEGVNEYRVTVLDNTGRVMLSGIATGANSTIDLRHLPAGIYNLQLIVDSKAYSKRIVRQ